MPNDETCFPCNDDTSCFIDERSRCRDLRTKQNRKNTKRLLLNIDRGNYGTENEVIREYATFTKSLLRKRGPITTPRYRQFFRYDLFLSA